MPNQPSPTSQLFSQVDVSCAQPHPVSTGDESNELLRDILTAQDRSNELLEELVTMMSAQHKQRRRELKQWKEANPRLANSCKKAAEALSHVHVEYLDRLTEEINEHAEDMVYGEFMLNEFVDRFGPRLAHLGGVLQTLAQLAAEPGNPSSSPK